MAHSRELKIPPLVRQALRTLGEATEDVWRRTEAAYVIWAWMTVPRSRRTVRDAAIAHRLSLAGHLTNKLKDARTNKAVAKIGFLLAEIAPPLIERIVIDQKREQNTEFITPLIELADATLRKFIEDAKLRSFEKGYESYETDNRFKREITQDGHAKKLRRRWGARIIFLWAAHQAGLPFCRRWPHALASNGTTVVAGLLEPDLFDTRLDPISKLTNEQIETFLGLALWGITTWGKREPSARVWRAFHGVPATKPGQLKPTRTGGKKVAVYSGSAAAESASSAN